MLLALFNMFGAGLSAQLAGDGASHSRFRFGADCYAGVSLNANGTEYAWSNTGSPTGTNLGSWLVSGDADQFWARCTLNSGSLDAVNSGTGSWLQLNTTRNWAIVRTTDGTDLADFDIDIATDSGGANIVASANYTPSASRETA